MDTVSKNPPKYKTSCATSNVKMLSFYSLVWITKVNFKMRHEFWGSGWVVPGNPHVVAVITRKLVHIKTYFLCIKVALDLTLHYTYANPHKTLHWLCFHICFIRFYQRVLHNIVNFNFLFLGPVLMCSLCGLFNILDINRSFTLERWERKHFFLSLNACGMCAQLKWQMTFRPVVCGKQKVWKTCEYRSIVASVCSTLLRVLPQIPHLSHYIVIGAE